MAARSAPFAAYICPKCYEPVHLKAGFVRAAHFAHKHGAAREECELYVQSLYKTGAPHLLHHDNFSRVGQLRLGLRLHLKMRPMSWGLELNLGVKDISEGRILIDVGGRETEVDLAGNRGSSYPVIAEPQQSPYCVLSVSPPESQARIFDGRTCEGIRRAGMTAFTAVGRAGHALFYRAEKIEGGRTYVVVWQDSNADVNFPDEWESEPLEKRGEFSAALVFVPSLLSPTDIEWIRANLQLIAENKIPNIVQVWPPILNRITSQSIQSVRDNAIVIALDEVDANQPANVFVRCDEDERVALGVPGRRAFFRYESEGKPTARFLTQGAFGARLDVEFSLPSSTPWHALNASAVLKTTSTAGHVASVALHGQNALQAFMDIRRGDANLDFLSIPRSAQGRVRVRHRNTVFEFAVFASDKRIAGRKNGFHSDAEAVARLVDAVRKPDAEIVIDFAALGYVSLPAEPETKKAVASNELPERVRTLLKKHLFQFEKALVWPRPDARMTDFQLVRSFQRCHSKKGGSAITRYLEREVARYVDGIEK